MNTAVLRAIALAVTAAAAYGRALRSYGGSGDGLGEFRLIGPAGFASCAVSALATAARQG